ncbi:MAG: hypothetical protein IKG56_00720 [Clostridia bacterium]|nr:hypothetical protein [Clostridia bacterium]
MGFRNIIDRLFNSFFKDRKTLPQSTIDPYAQKVESIDDLELAKFFDESLTPEMEQAMQNYTNNGGIYNYPLQTVISEQHTIEIAKKFFASIDPEISAKINDIIDGNYPEIQLVMKPYDGKEESNVNSPTPNNKPLRVFVPIRGDLRQLYELVHELTHTLDTENGDTTTRKILGEVAPQCMERMLDSFLLGMTDEEIKKYGFDKYILEKDIKDRRITTFISRYHNAQALNNRRGNRTLDSRYMLAQIYSAHFNKFDIESQKNKIKSFIDCVRNDDFEGANSVLGIQINRNNRLQREFHIRETIEEIRNMLFPTVETNRIDKRKSKDIERNIEEH